MSSKNIRDASVVIANLLLTAALSSAVACSDDESKPDHEHTAADGGSKVDKSDSGKTAAASVAAEPLKLEVKVPGVQPGEENTQCVQLRLPNKDALNITKIHNTISNGSHHFIVTALTDQNAQESELTPCRAFAGALTGAPLTITQKRDDVVTLPEGIGYHFNSNQVMNLELHYINTTDKPLDIVAKTELYPAAADQELQAGSVILMGTAQFAIPPHESYETAPTFLKLPTGMQDVQFYAITGHTHRFGTNVSVHTAEADQKQAQAVYSPERFDWEAPEMEQLEPHVSVPKDGGFLLQCDWNNTSDNAVKWGESATAEMCFFWGYYYPKKDVISVVLDDMDQEKLKASVSQPPMAMPKQ